MMNLPVDPHGIGSVLDGLSPSKEGKSPTEARETPAAVASQEDGETFSRVLEGKVQGGRSEGGNVIEDPGSTHSQEAAPVPLMLALAGWGMMPPSPASMSPATEAVPGEVSALTGFDRVPGRIASEIAVHYSNRDGFQTLNLQLEPEHLGRLEVLLEAQSDRLFVRLAATTPESETVLRENIKELVEAIQARTGRFQHIEVRVELKGSEEARRESPREESGQFSQEDRGDDRGRDAKDQDGDENRPPTNMPAGSDPASQEG